MSRWRLILTSLACVLALAGSAAADEVDDVLALKAHSRDKVKRFEAEYLTETTQPSTVKNPKTVRMRYHLKLEKLPAAARKVAHQPWRMEAEVLEPIPMHLKVEGEQAWFLDQNGTWVELPLTPELRDQFFGMSERFLGADPAEQRKHFGIKIVRHNNPVFGPRTRTLEFVPKGKAKMFARMEEDDNDDGFPLETRLYDDSGAETVRVKVKKHHKVSGVSVVDEMESVSTGPFGQVASRARSANVELDIEP